MAQTIMNDFGELNAWFDEMDRETIRRLMKAGGNAVAKRMQDVIEEHHHVITRDMKKATEMSYIHEDMGHASVDIYPGAKSENDKRTSKTMIRNSTKAIFIELYGKKDSFVTGTNLGYEEAADKAMQEEIEKINAESNR